MFGICWVLDKLTPQMMTCARHRAVLVRTFLELLIETVILGAVKMSFNVSILKLSTCNNFTRQIALIRIHSRYECMIYV